jgi:type IV pilus assembly protein PilV
MMSLGVLTLGMAGVIALQKVTLASNTNARNLSAATAIAQAWVERIRTDALQWNNPNLDDMDDTTWVKLQKNAETWCVGGGQGQTKGWQIPTYSAPTLGTPSADVTGSNLYAGDASAAAFCTHVRFTRTYPAPPKTSRLLRVEVRTFWEKSGQPIDCTVDPALFGDDIALGTDAGRYGFVYLTTGVLQNTSPL